MKILYVTTIGGTMGFFKNLIKELLDEGHTVDIATNDKISFVADCYKEWNCKIFSISCTRSPLNTGTIKAIKEIKKIVETNDYDIVHCHTPIAAMCTRFACIKARKKGVKVIYTAHGFHFYKGAPLKNWLMYYPVEKICAHFTDTLITINKEDYAFAQKKIKAKEVLYVPGVGIDLEKFGKSIVDRLSKRQELDIPEDATVLLSVGELNKNKNHETAIKAIADTNFYYIIAGRGILKEQLQSLIDELNIQNRVKLIGYRNDIEELYQVSDLFVFPSFREGLSVALMESMACSLPVVCSKIRGNTDLIDENGGALFDPYSISECRVAINNTLGADTASMGLCNSQKIKNFSRSYINKQMKKIYSGMK